MGTIKFKRKNTWKTTTIRIFSKLSCFRNGVKYRVWHLVSGVTTSVVSRMRGTEPVPPSLEELENHCVGWLSPSTPSYHQPKHPVQPQHPRPPHLPSISIHLTYLQTSARTRQSESALSRRSRQNNKPVCNTSRPTEIHNNIIIMQSSCPNVAGKIAACTAEMTFHFTIL